MTRSTKRCPVCRQKLRKSWRAGKPVYGHTTYADAQACLEEKARRQAA